MKKGIILISLLPTLFFLHCTKDHSSSSNPVLPPETQIGANTFGCKVNGEVWIPEVPVNFGGLYKLETDYYQGVFFVSAQRKSRNGPLFSIHLNITDGFYNIRKYHFFKDSSLASFNDYSKPDYCIYKTDSLNKGELKITKLDTKLRIISGTFYFDAKSSCGTIKITEGRFDVNY